MPGPGGGSSALGVQTYYLWCLGHKKEVVMGRHLFGVEGGSCGGVLKGLLHDLPDSDDLGVDIRSKAVDRLVGVCEGLVQLLHDDGMANTLVSRHLIKLK
eukprot:scaffold581601_cov24-Prasinocladus_malaysianus.AAC.1